MALNILVVDDSKLSRSVILKTLRLSGAPIAETYEATNGEEALQQLRAHWVDFVMTDIHMPVMNGHELVKRMRADEEWKGIPVIVITSEFSADREAELKSEGIIAYLRKPFTPEHFRTLICDLTGVSS